MLQSQKPLQQQLTKKILLIEDSPTQTIKTVQLLQDSGYEVQTAPNGRAGFTTLGESIDKNSFQPDLVVLDTYLPDMNGFEFCQWLKEHTHLRGIPVIMYSAEEGLASMVKAYSTGADYYVVKSETGEKELLTRILLALHRQNQVRNGRH
jgi:DNA-binding response OmpR family regulator